jgi:hypothetical protein
MEEFKKPQSRYFLAFYVISRGDGRPYQYGSMILKRATFPQRKSTERFLRTHHSHSFPPGTRFQIDLTSLSELSREDAFQHMPWMKDEKEEEEEEEEERGVDIHISIRS